jgi:hypothetical protein
MSDITGNDSYIIHFLLTFREIILSNYSFLIYPYLPNSTLGFSISVSLFLLLILIVREISWFPPTLLAFYFFIF